MVCIDRHVVLLAIVVSSMIGGPFLHGVSLGVEPDAAGLNAGNAPKEEGNLAEDAELPPLRIGNPKLARQLLKSFEDRGLKGVRESMQQAPDEVWHEALETLGEIANRHPESRKLLILIATTSGDFWIRVEATRALNKLESEDPEILNALVFTADLEDDEVDVTVLQRLGKKAESILRAGLKSPSPDVRRNSIGLLAELDLEQALLSGFCRTALQDEDPSVRRRAAMVLVDQEHITAEVAIVLVDCLKLEPKVDPQVGRVVKDWHLHSAIRSCDRLAFEPLISLILDKESPHRARRLGIEMLEKIAGYHNGPVHLSPSFQPLYTALASDDLSIQAWAALALASAHEQAFEAVPDLLRLATETGPLQRDAVVALGKLKSWPELFPEPIALALLELATSSEDQLAEDAFSALRRKRFGPRAMAKILELIQQDKHQAKMARIIISNSWKSQYEPKLIPDLIKYLISLDSYHLEGSLEVFTSWEREGAIALAKTALNPELEVETRIKFLHALSRNLRHGSDVSYADEHLPALARLLESDQPELAQAAATALAVAEYDEVSLADHLFAGLKSEDYSTRSQAARAIEARASEGDAIATMLLEGLPHQDESTQRDWIRVLGTITRNSQIARGAMVDRWLQGQSTGEWRIAFSGLDRSIVPRLLEIIDGDDNDTKTRAMTLLNSLIGVYQDACCRDKKTPQDELMEMGLEEVPPGLLEALNANDIQLRKTAALLLRRFDPQHRDAMDALMDALEQEAVTRGSYSAAAQALRGYGPRLEPHIHRLIDLLEDPDRQVQAAEALAGMGPAAEPAMPKILEVIQDEIANDESIYWLDKLLQAIGPRAKEAEVVLANHFFELHHSEFVAQTYSAIDGSLDLIEPQIETRLSDPMTRLETLEALAALAVTSDVSPWFRAALTSDNLEFRYHAAKVLGKYRTPPVSGTYQLLLDMTKHPRPELRSVAAMALGRQSEDTAITVSTLSEMLTEDENIQARIGAAESLVNFGEEASPAVPSLIAVLHQMDVDVPAVEALGAIGPDAAPAVNEFEKILMKPLDAQDEIHHVRVLHSAILETLIKIGPSAKAIVPTLLKYRSISGDRGSRSDLSEAIWTLDPETAKQQGIGERPVNLILPAGIP